MNGVKLKRSLLLVSPYALLLTVLVSLLYRDFDPPPCTKKVTGPLGSSIIINCDSAQFMQDSQDFNRVLSGNSSYQDRPLYALSAKLLASFFSRVIKDKRSFENSNGMSIDFYYSHLLSFYVINVIVLLISLFFLIQSLRNLAPFPCCQLMSLISIVFLNDIVKGFFWTPHTQLFNILLITFSLYSWSRFGTSQISSNAIVWFFSVALLVHYYPSLLLLILIPLSISLKKYALLSLIPISSFLMYPSLIRVLGGKYRNAAMEDFNQFVWIFEVRTWQDVTSRFRWFYVELDKFLLLTVVVLICIDMLLRIAGRTVLMKKSIWFFIGGYGFFILMMGFYATRLSTPFLLLILVVVLIDLRTSLPRNLFGFLLHTIAFMVTIQFFLFQGQLT